MNYEVADGMTGLVVDRFETEEDARSYAKQRAIETGRWSQLWSMTGLVDTIDQEQP